MPIYQYKAIKGKRECTRKEWNMENDQNNLEQTTVDRNIRKTTGYQKQTYDDYLAQSRYNTNQNLQNQDYSTNSYSNTNYSNTGYQDTYRQNNSFGQNVSPDQTTGYNQNMSFNQNNTYNPNGGFQQNSGFQQNAGFPQNGGFQQNNTYNPNMYGNNVGYQNQGLGNTNFQNNYANGQYGNDPGIPNLTPFQEEPKKSKKVTVIVIIIVALLAVAAVILAFVYGSRDDDKGSKKKQETVVQTTESETEPETVIETETESETETEESVEVKADLITPYDYYMENDTISVDTFIESCYGGDWDAFKADCVEYDPQTLLDKGYNYTGDPVKFTGVVSYTDSDDGIYYISKTGMVSNEILFIDDSVELDPVRRGDYVTFYGMYVTNIDDTDTVKVPGCYLIAIDELNYCDDQELVALTYSYTDEESIYAEDMSSNITYSIFKDDDYASLDFFFATEKCENFCILVQTRFYDEDKNLIYVSSDTSDFYSDQTKSLALIDLPHRKGDYYDLIDFDSYEYDMYIYEVPSYEDRSVEEITYEIEDNGGQFELELTNNTDEERALSACIVTYDEDGKIVETYVAYIDPFTGTTTKTVNMYSSDYAGYEVIYYYIF